ncbi:MAG: ectonucleotide pyrophosphatase/phosphodiesterase, partial [Oscillospiraceae bacterium]
MQKKRLLVLSVDAMVHEDLSYLFSRPNFKRYMQGTSEVERVRTIYPSVTYPVHVSMLTGCYPDRHGIYSNFAFTTDSKEDTWHWFAQDVKVEDILTVAKRAGYSTGSVFWPVTGRHPDVDYLIDEYWMPNADDTLCGAFARAGSCDAVLKIIARHENLMAESHHKTGRTNVMVQPHIDDFLIACACDMIREFQPEVMLVHNGIIDGTRHKHGVFNDCVTEGLDLVD